MGAVAAVEQKFLALALSALLLVSVFAVAAAAIDWNDGQTVGETGNYTVEVVAKDAEGKVLATYTTATSVRVQEYSII